LHAAGADRRQDEYPKLFTDLALDIVDEPVGKVSTRLLIKCDAELLMKSLLEAPGVKVWSGMCTLFNNLIRGTGFRNSILESLSRWVKSTDSL
jgi:hypothetical protein